MAQEIGVAYLSIVPETSKIAPGVKAALGAADRQATAAGKSMGDRMSGALGKALKGGAVVAGAAAAAGIGTALTKGFQRLNAIDQAEGKLAALGNTTKQTATIMDSALASVKGTAYGLGDAATIAASAVAAGVKPGQELTKYLSSVADSAAIAGTSLSDMGTIFNQVQTGQQAYTDDLNQLADRGIPIYQWLGKEAGVAAGEVKKMASEGKISSEMFFAAINKNVGGAAAKIGSSTVSGAIDNIGAALGRLGAAAEKPFFDRLPGMIGGATGAIDAMTPKVQALSEKLADKVFDEWGPKVREALAEFERTGSMERAQDVFSKLVDEFGDAAPSIGAIATELGRASAALGVSGWQIFLTALDAGTTTLGILNPLLSTTADLMENNRGLVTAFMAAWLLTKTIPGYVTGISGALGGLRDRMAAASASVASFGSAYQTSLGYVRQANPSISTAGAHLQVLRSNGIGASTAMSGMKAGAGLLAGAMGGPLGIALAAGGVALGAYAKHQADAAQKAAEHKAKVDALSESINFNTGALDANGKKQVYQSLADGGAFKDLKASGANVTSAQLQSAAEGQASALKDVNAELDAVVMRGLEAGGVTDDYAQRLNKAGFTLEDYTAALRGNQQMQQRINEGMGSNMDFDAAAKDWDKSANAAVRAGAAAVRMGHNIGTSTDAIREAQEAAKQETEALGLVQKRLESLSGQFDGQGKGFSINVDTSQIAGTEDILTRLGFTLQSLPNGQVKVTANTEEAAAKLSAITQNVTLLNALKANPTIDINKGMFDAKSAEARGILAQLDQTQVSPEAGLIIQKLLDGKAVSMSELATLDASSANPAVNLLIDQLLKNAETANQALDNAARKREAIIEVQTFNTQGAQNGTLGRAGVSSGPGRANGGQVFGPGGPKDDAFLVPLSNREYVHQVSAVDYYGTGVMDAINNRRIPREAMLHPGRATGGQVLKELAEGKHGASQPLTGAPYAWGGVNWGDCSGAMSAFARAAVGLPPFGGRFSTASMGAQLSQMGFTMGRGTSGDLRFGWYNGGPGGGHTAGTLPDGTNIEMGGSYGGGMLGGSVGADASQFTDHAYLTVSPDLKLTGVPGDNGGFVIRPDGTIGPAGDGSGNAATSSGTTTPVTPASTFSGRLGDAAKAAVEGQVQSLFGLLDINDSPGALAAATELQSQQNQSRGSSSTGIGSGVTDPGTDKPGEGEDLGGAAAGKAVAASTGNAVKDAFRSGLREAWRSGEPWTDTDFIIGKESGWDPTATNPQSGAYGLPQFLGATKDKYLPDSSSDPKTQGTAYDKYVGDRYGDPMKARDFWEANNWYDQGGIARNKGVLLKNINQPERVLSPQQTKSFDQMVRQNFQSDIGTSQIVAKLDELIAAVAINPRGQVNYNLRDERGLKRAENAEKRRIGKSLTGV